MTIGEIRDLYFEYMYNLVYDDSPATISYKKLLTFLNEVEFTYTIPMDSNRAGDGIDLRYRFSYDEDIPYEDVKRATDELPCSILEMMVALAVRIEESIASDIYIGDRTSQWFWGMIASLGLGKMSDRNFKESEVHDIVQRFLNRKYSRTGKGGLFTIPRTREDLRDVEIWYQMNWYLDEVL